MIVRQFDNLFAIIDTTTAMATLMKPLRDKWAELEIASLDKSRLIRALLKTVAPKHNPIAQAAPTPQPNGQTVPATIVGANTAVKQPAVSSYAVPSTVTVQEQELSVANTTAAETGSQISPQSIPVVNQDHPLREEYEDVVLPDLRRMIHKYFSTDGFQRIQIDPLTSSSPQKLTILIHCPSPRNMRRAVKRTRCIDKQKFEVKYKRGEKLRSTAGAGNMENQPIGLNISGNPIYAFLHDELLGTALIGGLVQIQGESGGHFETTVFHFLTETQGTHQPTDSDMILEIAVDGTTSSIASETSSSTSSFSVLGSEDQPEESIYLDNFSFRDIQLRTHAEPAIQIEPLPGDSEKKQLQKSIHAVSGVRVSKIPFSQGSRKSSRALRCIMDWTLISVENGPLSPTTYIRDGNDGPVTMTITSTTSPGGRAVDILVEGRVYCQGRTAGLPSLLPLHSKPEFGLAFMVSTDHKLRKRASFLKYYSDSRADEEQMSTEEGMSGAWIVDSDTAELVGHLIAVSTSSPWGYFIPIMETIEDMKATLNASNVRPPQEGMVEAHLPAGPIEHSHSISNEIRESRGDPRPSRRDSTYTEPGNRGRMVVVDEGSQAAVISARDSVPLGSREPARSLRYPMSSRIPQPQDRPEPIVTANPHIDPVDVFNEGGIHPYFLPARSLFIGRLRHVHTAVALTLKRKFGNWLSF
jgi:hypothetical protein